MKNINSIRGLVNAIEYEVDRQIEILENGGIIENETRNYDGNTKKTVSMRDKEVKQDYRFMPEPNLPPLRLDLNFGGKPETENNPNILNVKHYQDNLPELPEKTRQKVVDEFGLGFELVVRLVNEPELLELFLDAQNCGEKILCQTRLAHLLLLDVVEICSKHLKPIKNCINPEFLATATNMKFKDEITSRIINNAFECVILGKFGILEVAAGVFCQSGGISAEDLYLKAFCYSICFFLKKSVNFRMIFDVLNFPINQRKNLMNFCPRI